MLQKITKALMPWRKPVPRIAVLRLSGVIAAGGRLGAGLSIGALAPSLERAFTIDAEAVALVINSPGGSAAQSHLIHKRIRALAKEKQRKVIAFVEDVAASGGYMIACAADEIFADESSILGSIGVISAGFGFTELIAKIGVERRVHAAGEYKSTLDPFRPENPDDIARLKAIQRDIHQEFIALVKGSRGAKLKGGDELFTGEFWAGGRSVELGLADAIGDIKTVTTERYGDKVKLVPVGQPRGLLRRGLGLEAFAQPLDGLFAGLADDGLAQLEARSLWSRFGL
jgi:signal peptide peptidase SppA